MKFYDPDAMSNDSREEFLNWYFKHEHDVFDFSKEIHEYCLSDVKILMEGCIKFRDLVMSVTGEEILELNLEEMIYEKKLHNSIDPFSFLTIPSVCLGIFRSNFLKEKWKVLTTKEYLKNNSCHHESNCRCHWLEGRKINAKSPLEVLVEGEWVNADLLSIKKSVIVSTPLALIPPHGYNKPDNHSLQSLQWLALLEKKYRDTGYNIKIQHARSPEGEKVVHYNSNGRIIPYKLDGDFEIGDKKFACEFNGCNWHGCPKCYI